MILRTRTYSRPVRIGIAFLLLAAIGTAVGGLYLLYGVYGIGIPCLIRAVTGLYCPGCGAGRALAAAFHGNWGIAFRQNAVFVTLVPLIVLYFLLRLFDWAFTGQNHIDRYIPNRVLIAVWIAILGFAVLRNLPFRAFAFLRPF